jgi:geranylgeranyl diphosphate synthase type I
MSLEHILRENARIFDRALNGYLAPRNPKIIYDAIRWIPLSGGKRLRPILAMLSCEAVGGMPETTIPLGIALEYMHNSTLIHDDIIDGDKWRRGLQTTHEKYGTPLAILAGDALIGETYRMLSYMAPPELNSVTYKQIIRAIADAAKNFYEGEAMDIQFDKRYDVTLKEYTIMIEKKTGQLYWLAGKCGALMGKGSQKQVESLAQYGLLFGIMFQIKDDLLNLITNQAQLGKQMVGSDIINGKRTLMLIHSLQNATEAKKKRIVSIIEKKNATHKDVMTVIDIFKATGSLDYAKHRLLTLSKKAKYYLHNLKESESKHILKMLTDYSITRKY